MLHLVTVIAFLFSFLNPGESYIPTRLTISSPTAHIRVGTSVTLTCNIFELEDSFFTQGGSVVFNRYGNNNVRTQLSYYTPTYFNTTHPRYRVRGIQRSDRYVVNLEMTEAIKEDASEYQCALYRAGVFVKGSMNTQLEWIRTAPTEYPKCDVYVHNDMLHLSCESADSVPPPDLVWFHNGLEVSRRTDIRYSVTLNSLVMNLTDIDGTYECRFYYVGGGINDERSCRIEKPNIMFVSPTNNEFINGSDAEMTVLARANPPMTTPMKCAWDHSNSRDFSVQNRANDLAIISIRNIDLTVNGSEITCCGRNFLGQSCQSISIYVKEADAPIYLMPASQRRRNRNGSCRIEKPNIMFVSPANNEFINGSHAEMTVLARANPPMTTPMNCEWDHSYSRDFSVQNRANDLAIISIRNIDLTVHGSEITCCGQNILGQSCQSISIYVKKAGAPTCLFPASQRHRNRNGMCGICRTPFQRISVKKKIIIKTWKSEDYY